MSKDLSQPPSISAVVGNSVVLPGESLDEYQGGLRLLIHELQAKTVLQVYLAEKMFDCLWWVRRYDNQKRHSLFAEMARFLAGRRFGDQIESESEFFQALQRHDLDDAVQEALERRNHTLDSLTQAAMRSIAKDLRSLDDQIALQAKILAGFQASYEAATNRSLNIERLALQNRILTRDLGAIDPGS